MYLCHHIMKKSAVVLIVIAIIMLLTLCILRRQELSYQDPIITDKISPEDLPKTHEFESNSSPHLENWKLVWSDEFDALTSNWNLLDDSHGYANRKQHYTPNNVSVTDGLLNIIIREEESAGLPYTSGAITTKNKVHFKYGKLEVRAQLPKGQGLIPAIWMLPASGKEFPEIDIAEIVGQQPTELWNVVHDEKSGEHIREYHMSNLLDITNKFHIYSMEWSADSITYKFDGKVLFVGRNIIPQEPMYLYINTGVGGNWVGEPDSNTKFPNVMSVDYVRYYSNESGGE